MLSNFIRPQIKHLFIKTQAIIKFEIHGLEYWKNFQYFFIKLFISKTYVQLARRVSERVIQKNMLNYKLSLILNMFFFNRKLEI